MKTKIISINHFLSGRIKTAQKYINPSIVKKYRKEIDKGHYPLVIVSKGHIIDGNHRLKAYIEAKAQAVKVRFLNNKDLTGYLFPRKF